jgi:hypothetical protein
MGYNDDKIDNIIMLLIINEEATHSANKQKDNEYSNENILTLPNILNWSNCYEPTEPRSNDSLSMQGKDKQTYRHRKNSRF